MEIRLLGVPMALCSGRWLALERHDALLLAVLALEGPQPRAPLAALLWPDTEPRRALGSLRQRLYRLRRRLGHPLLAEAGTLALLPEVRHDLHNPGDEALHAEHGLLAGHDYADLDSVAGRVTALQDRWTAARLQALEERADALERDGRLDEALRLAERLVASSPASEHAHRRCIRLHYLRGDAAQALVAVARCRERLQALLELSPGSETEALARLVATAAQARQSPARLPPVAWQRPPRLVGRQQPWALLDAACSAGLVVLLRGDAGMGKTRLASEFCHRRGPCLAAKADPADAGLPLALVQRLLAQGEATAVPAGVPWRQLAQVFGRWAEQPRATVFIDDLQWADEASLQAMLDALALGRPARLPVLLAVRDGAVPDALSGWLHRLPPGQWLDLPLAPLDEPAVRELLDDLGWPGVPAHRREQMLAVLARRAAGHPLLLLELLRARGVGDAASAALAQPSRLSAQRQLHTMLARRAARLEPEAQSVLRVAACAGPAFTLALAAEVAELPEPAVESAWTLLAHEQLLQDDHLLLDTVATAVLQATPVPVAQATHRALAAALQARGERPERVAQHWQSAEVWAPAAAAFAQAAREHAPRDAEVMLLWDRCATAHRRAGQQTEAAVADAAALVAALSVEGERDLQQRIDRMRAAAVTTAERLQLLLVEARAHINAAAAARALSPATEAQALAAELGDARAALQAASWRALAQALLGEVEPARQQLHAAREQLGETADALALSVWSGSLGYVLHLAGDHAAACPALAQAAAWAEAAGALGDAFEHVGNLSTCLNMQGRATEARQAGEQALALWRRLGEPASVSAALVHAQVAAVALSEGAFDSALEQLAWALQAFRRQGSDSLAATTEHRLAHALWRLGQPARARQVLTPLPAEADAGRRVARAMMQVRLDGLQGDRALARLRAAAPAAALLAASDSRAWRLHQAQHAPAPEALVLAQAVAAEAEAAADRPALAHAHARAALASVALGHRAEAARHLRAAWSAGQGRGALDLDPPTWLAWVEQAARAVGEDGCARQAFDAAQHWAQQARVPAAYRPSFQARLAALGVRVQAELSGAA